MARPKKDEEREERIQMEIIVDAYEPEEQALGWHAYLSDNLHFPSRIGTIGSSKDISFNGMR